MREFTNPGVEQVFTEYPDAIRAKVLRLRQLIFDTATALEDVGEIEETLKWGEPSYLAKQGSTIRIDWKPSSPDHYALYVHCQSKLIETYQELYGDQLHFQGKRAIVFPLKQRLPVKAVKHCVALALRYHQIKHLPLLGA